MGKILTETILGLMMIEEKKLPLATRVIRWSIASLSVLAVLYGAALVVHTVLDWFL